MSRLSGRSSISSGSGYQPLPTFSCEVPPGQGKEPENADGEELYEQWPLPSVQRAKPPRKSPKKGAGTRSALKPQHLRKPAARSPSPRVTHTKKKSSFRERHGLVVSTYSGENDVVDRTSSSHATALGQKHADRRRGSTPRISSVGSRPVGKSPARQQLRSANEDDHSHSSGVRLTSNYDVTSDTVSNGQGVLCPSSPGRRHWSASSSTYKSSFDESARRGSSAQNRDKQQGHSAAEKRPRQDVPQRAWNETPVYAVDSVTRSGWSLDQNDEYEKEMQRVASSGSGYDGGESSLAGHVHADPARILNSLPSRNIGPSRVSVRRLRNIKKSRPGSATGTVDKASLRCVTTASGRQYSTAVWNKALDTTDVPSLYDEVYQNADVRRLSTVSEDHVSTHGKSNHTIDARQANTLAVKPSSFSIYMAPHHLSVHDGVPQLGPSKSVFSMSYVGASQIAASKSVFSMNHAGAAMTGNLQSRRDQLDQARQNPPPRSRLTFWDGVSFQAWKLKKKIQGRLKDVWFTFGIWRTSLKTIEGRFGSSVVAYFSFLRALLFLNFFLTVMTISFVVAPQIVSGDNRSFLNVTESYRWDQVLVDCIVGRGVLRESIVYYGIYTDQKVGPFNLPIAYLLTGLLVLVTSFAWVLWSIGFSHQQQQLQKFNTTYKYTNKVFSAWDFNIANDDTAKLKAIATRRELEEYVADDKTSRQRLSWREKFRLYQRRLVVNILVAGFLALAGWCIYLTTNLSIEATRTGLEPTQQSTTETAMYYLKTLASSLTIAAFNAVLPIIFESLTALEKWRTPRQEVKYTLMRTVSIRFASLGVLVGSLFLRLRNCDTKNIVTSPECGCWELSVGQEFYQLAVLNYLIVLFSTLFGGLGQRLMYSKWDWYHNTIGPPNFPLVRNVLDLLYTQMIIWLGFFFSPVLPAIGVVSLFCFFYIKKWALLWFMIPSTKPYKGYRNSQLFNGLLLLVLCLALIPIGIVAFEARPSSHCGPFRGERQMYSVFNDWVRSGPSWIADALAIILSSSFAIPAFILLFTGIS
ncbi:transmembrane channel-like protein 7 [Sycon ciliatum]|uniref:transmembrane channel-like protein 7 n=1 Tax=Sycon ciliatum TaxID=27933 RepID=UPI0031F6BC29